MHRFCWLVCRIKKIFITRAKTVLKINWFVKIAVTRAHGSCSLRVMGCCFQYKKDVNGKMNIKKWNTKIPNHVCVVHKGHCLKSWFLHNFFRSLLFLIVFSPFWSCKGSSTYSSPTLPLLNFHLKLTVPKVTVAHYKLSRTL